MTAPNSRMLALLVVGALLAGCGPDGDPETGTAAMTAAVSAPVVAATEDAGAGVLASEEAVLSAGQLRLLLEQLLGEHVFLVADAAAQHADGLDTEASLDLVGPNTEALTDAIALVYGDVGARAFASLWSQHVAFFLDHARGTAAGDEQVIAEATGHLGHYEDGFGSFTATATGGALPAAAVAQLLGVHVTDINGYVAARLAGDVDASTAALVTGHDYAADIGATLAGAIASQGPTAFPGESTDPRTEVAVELARAFANHLAVNASAGAPDTEAAAGDTGAGDTGAGDTGAGDTGAGEAGAGDTGAGDADEASSGASEAAVAAAAERLDAALRAAADDPEAAVAAWQRATTTPRGLTADTRALAIALGVPELGPRLAAIATVAAANDATDASGAEASNPASDRVVDAHRAAFEVASTWLG